MTNIVAELKLKPSFSQGRMLKRTIENYNRFVNAVMVLGRQQNTFAVLRLTKLVYNRDPTFYSLENEFGLSTELAASGIKKAVAGLKAGIGEYPLNDPVSIPVGLITVTNSEMLRIPTISGDLDIKFEIAGFERVRPGLVEGQTNLILDRGFRVLTVALGPQPITSISSAKPIRLLYSPTPIEAVDPMPTGIWPFKVSPPGTDWENFQVWEQTPRLSASRYPPNAQVLPLSRDTQIGVIPLSDPFLQPKFMFRNA